MGPRKTAAKGNNVDETALKELLLQTIKEKYEILWNQKSNEYTKASTQDKNKAWDNVSVEIGGIWTGKECYNKFRNLRTTYRQRKATFEAAAKKSGCSTAEVEMEKIRIKKMWVHYESMSFLEECVQHAENESNIDGNYTEGLEDGLAITGKTVPTQVDLSGGSGTNDDNYLEPLDDFDTGTDLSLSSPLGRANIEDCLVASTSSSFNINESAFAGHLETQSNEFQSSPPLANNKQLFKAKSKTAKKLSKDDMMKADLKIQNKRNKLLEFELKLKSEMRSNQMQQQPQQLSPEAHFLLSFEKDLQNAGEGALYLKQEISRVFWDFKKQFIINRGDQE